MNDIRKYFRLAVALAPALLLATPIARADVVTDWNVAAADITVAAGRRPPPANRTLAMVQTAVYEAVNAITKRYPPDRVTLQARARCVGCCRSRRGESRDSVAPGALAAGRDRQGLRGRARRDRRRPGKDSRDRRRRTGRSGRSRLARGRCAGASERYRPATTAGVYVPTDNPRRSAVAAAQAMGDDLVRPVPTGPPPALTSELWARDYNEIKAVGAQEQYDENCGADRDRALLGSDRADDLLSGRAFSRQYARQGGDAERAALRADRRGDRRRDDRGLRCQVPLQLLATGHRDSQRGHRRQRCDRTRRRLAAVHRHADAPRISLRALHRLRSGRRRC